MNLQSLSKLLQAEGITDTSLQLIRSVGGGCINECFQVQSGSQYYFLKVNSAAKYPGMFVAESAGLQLLKANTSLTVPAVIYQAEIEDVAYLLMEFIHTSPHSNEFWRDFGSGLADLHRKSSEEFGLDHSNYIGSLRQNNSWRDSWATFFLECRLIPQLEAGIQQGWTDRSSYNKAEALCQVVANEFPVAKPALLHGDLWSGNFMSDHQGRPALVDPAVYYGHPEVDLAFTKMFGGFHESFYEYYHNNFPIEAGFEQRVEIHNLYPLLVHANLFGGHYVEQVRRLLNRFA